MKCDHCPLAGTDRPCAAEVTGHRRYCELIDPTGPDHHPEYIPFLRDWVDPTSEPGWLEKVASFAAAALDHLTHGLTTLDAQALEARFVVCRDCPNVVGDCESCRACGCNLRVKASWAEQSCPLGKWPGDPAPA